MTGLFGYTFLNHTHSFLENLCGMLISNSRIYLCPKLRVACCKCEKNMNKPIGHSGVSQLFCAPWTSCCLQT